MLKIDAFRLIKTTAKRFISLVCIVLIGVAFMLGLFITPGSMRDSVDAYNKEINLSDIQIYSSYGFCDEDIEELEKRDDVETVYGSKQIDLYANYANSKTCVMRIRELDSGLNTFTLLDGRLPILENEIVLTEEYQNNIPIYSVVTLSFDDDSDVLEQLKYDQYVVVGHVKTSEYMAKLKSTSNFNNLDLQVVAYANNSIFLNDYYTTLYIKGVNDCESYFDDDYDDFLNDFISNIEEFALVQQDYYKTVIYEKALKEVEDGEKTLAKERTQALKELEDAKSKLTDAKGQIDSGEAQLNEAKNKLDAAQKEINAGKVALEEGKATLATKETEYLNYKAEVEAALAALEAKGTTLDEAISQLESLCTTYDSLQNSKTEGLPAELESSAIGNLRELKEIQDNLINALISQVENLDDDSIIRDVLLSQLANAQEASESLGQQIETAITNAKAAYDAQIDASLLEIENQAGGNPHEMLSQLQQLVGVDEKLEEARLAIENGKAELEANEQKLTSGQAEVDRGYNEYYDALAEYYEGIDKYDEGNSEYVKAVKEFNTKIDDAETKLKKARQDLEELPDAKWTIVGRESCYANYMYHNTCKQMESICVIMPVLFYLVAALVCLTTMTRLIDEERGQIGIYCALGYRKTQILSKYLLYVSLACLIGSTIGIFVGAAIFPTVIYNTWRLMYNLPQMILTIPYKIVLICFGSFLLLMVIVTTYVVMKSLNETAAALLRPKAPKKTKKVLLERISFIWNMFSFTGKITVRNLFRYKARFIMSVLGVAGCTSLLVLGFGIKDSISDVINLQYGEIFNYQYNVNLDSDSNVKEITSILNNDDTNEYLMPYLSYYSKIYFTDYNKSIQVCVFNENDALNLFNFKDSDNNAVTFTKDTVSITEKFANVHNIKVGDQITFESKDGLKATVTVTDIYKMYFQHYLYISEDMYEDIFDSDVHYTTIALKSTNTIENIDSYLTGVDQYASTTSFTSMIEAFDTMIQSLDTIVLVIIITAGSLAFVVLFNLIQVNISERIREIATLKVLGFKDREVNTYLFKEIILLTIIGGILGMPLGKIELNFIMTAINMEMIMFPTDIKNMSYIYGFIISFVFTLLVLVYTGKELKKVKMVESLKSVE